MNAPPRQPNAPADQPARRKPPAPPSALPPDPSPDPSPEASPASSPASSLEPNYLGRVPIEPKLDRQEQNRQGAFAIVAIAASAGGLNAISEVLSGLPAEFPVAIVVVQHLDPRHRSLMADILSRRTALVVKQAEEGDMLTAGSVYIAPPDRHLLVNPDGRLSLTQTELVHFVRPSADLLFESVAASYTAAAIAIVLSGTGNDGGMGVEAIKKMGGTVIAQNQATADFFGMPKTAIETGCVDFILPLTEIAPALMTLVAEGSRHDQHR